MVQTDAKTADLLLFISFSGSSGDSPFKEETMTKQTKKQMLMLAAIASIGLSAPSAFAQVNDVVVDGKGEIPYVIDARDRKSVV